MRENVRSSRFRTPVLIGAGLLFVLMLSANGVARTYTDWLWFDNLGLGSVWATILGTQIALAAVFTLIFFLILWGNLVLADRLAPDMRPASPEEDLIERYHQIVGNRAGKLRFGIAAVFALIAGANTASQWQEWLLFRNGGSFDWQDPLHGQDAGFYVFTLPFLSFIVDWLFAALILTVIVVAVAHYLNGGIRAAAPTERVSSGVKLHLSILLAGLAVVRAAGYFLDRFTLVNSTRSVYDGALATDVNIQLPAYSLLALISLFGAALFIANIRRQGWGLPMTAIGLWAISHLFIGSIFPAVYQRLRVEPQASVREAEFVERNIEATRFAYGLDDDSLTIEQFTYQAGITSDELVDFEDVLDNVPLVDPQAARDSFTRSQGERAFYSFSDPLDVDRYQIDGQTRPVVLSVRGLDLAVDEVGQGWESQHILFTHGYGAAVAAGWDVDPNGRPRFLVGDLGDVSVDPSLNEELTSLEQPRVYFGENFGGYAIVNAARDEVDYQTSSNDSRPYRYSGDGGVDMGSFLRRIAFALRFRELDPLISQSVTSESSAIYNRDVAERVRTVAPFLDFDSNPYPVMADGGLVWVIDGYTTSSSFPYSQGVDTDLVGSDISGGYNYVRNSVKAVVDAYDGDVTLYVIDPTDPILQAWTKSFPSLFADASEISPDLRDNLRYPEDIFEVQTDMWSTYVVTDPVQLIQGDVAWSVAAQPRSEAQVGEGDTATNSRSMDPQYLVTRLPGEDGPEFVLQRAFVPRSGEAGSTTARPELTGIMMARSDPGENFGQLVLYEIPSGRVEAPDFVHSEIRKNAELTDFLRDQIGSVVTFGQMTLLLVNDTIVYVRPVYVEAASRTAVPELARVIAVNDDQIAMGESLDEVLAEIVDDPEGVDIEATTEDEAAADGSDGDEPEDNNDSTPAYDTTGKSVLELISDADKLLADAESAEAGGFMDEAEGYRAQARTALTAAEELLGGNVATTPAPESQADET
ncbi:MAG: UPF0182 family membrane protein [Acidimicrobiales bacterium]